jgi:hypothetical protein
MKRAMMKFWDWLLREVWRASFQFISPLRVLWRGASFVRKELNNAYDSAGEEADRAYNRWKSAR